MRFKKAYGATLKAVDRLLARFCRDMSAQLLSEGRVRDADIAGAISKKR